MSHIPGYDLVRELAPYGITLDEATANAVAVYDEVGKVRQPVDTGAAVVAALHRGEVTKDNVIDLVRRAASDQIALTPGPHGNHSYIIAQQVENAAANRLAIWYDVHADEHVEILSALFLKAAKVVNTEAPKALSDAPTPEQILEAGKSALDARTKAQQAAGQLSVLHALINRVLINVDRSILGIGAFIADPDKLSDEQIDAAEELLTFSNWIGIARDLGLKITINSPDVAAGVDAAIAARREAARAAAEVEEWLPKIRAEAERLIDLRERGLTPAWVMKVPDHLVYLIDQVADEMDLPSRSRPRRPVVVSGGFY